MSSEKAQAFRDWRADYLEARLADQQAQLAAKTSEYDAAIRAAEARHTALIGIFNNTTAVEETLAVIKKYEHFEVYNG